ncbi:peptide deformylase [Streptomyces sp. NPDC087532]|uniref:peptide deformylase n=1 Tax=Streptomyces sp. NPDC087532 TaxID=3365795 RepID=UPI003813DCE3
MQARDFSGKGVGLAAPQIGMGRSAAVVRPAEADPIVLLNPRVTRASGAVDEKYEGCLSFFDVRAPVSRPLHITVESVTLDCSTTVRDFTRGDAGLSRTRLTTSGASSSMTS